MEKRKKIKVLTLSKVFMKGHPRAGEPTYFKNSITLNYVPPSILLAGPSCINPVKYQKIHTIRNTSDWIEIAEKVNRGEMVVSVRQWIGKPYQTKQDDPIAVFNRIGIQKITIANRVSHYGCYVDGILYDTELIARNDGLSKQDFIDWFKPYFKKGEMLWNGVIIHFTDSRYK